MSRRQTKTTLPATTPETASPTDEKNIQPALDALHRYQLIAPEYAIILGSGLGQLADAVESPTVIPTQEIPGYPRSTAPGHQGRLVFGILEGKQVVVIQGRVHYYEGYSAREVTFPVRLVNALGAKKLLVTNAAGGINPHFKPGTLMFISDHINAAFANPLIGPNIDGGPRFPDLHNVYDAAWLAQAEQAALKAGIKTQRGIYLWTQGPSYETKAEIGLFRNMGADAVGMSTVPEVLQANYLGMRVLGISTITNPAAGLSAIPLNHDDVMEVGKSIKATLERLVRLILQIN